MHRNLLVDLHVDLSQLIRPDRHPTRKEPLVELDLDALQLLPETEPVALSRCQVTCQDTPTCWITCFITTD
ncbi:hypothetical protein GA0070610_1894 [Micromonospora echinofusca]|uniref:Uncharacterized protein n=1 Tax=Micromonospora echinofusca TaxID=47858 RepID=A0A1C5G6V7_MICEH|nr:hypothetical protein GA0070610_1894 [Micromonospora echinofusca]